MNRYLNSHPAHVEFLDMVRLEVGFRVNFFGLDIEKVDAVPGSSAPWPGILLHVPLHVRMLDFAESNKVQLDEQST